MKYATIFITVVMLHSILTAHIKTAECWEKLDKKIYCLSDYHGAEFKKNCISNDQRKSIIKGARAFNAHLIVEDIGGTFAIINDIVEPTTGSKNLTSIYDMMKSDYIVPIGISSLCYRAGIPVTNIEFRFLATSDGKQTLKEELSSLDARAEKTLKYDDEEKLKPFYASVVKSYKDIVYKDGKSFFDYLAKTNKRITSHDLHYAPYGSPVDKPLQKIFPDSYLANMHPYDKKKLLLELFSTFLIDSEIVHAVAQNQDKKRIIVCAGGAHIRRIAAALKAMGYTKTDSVSGGYSYDKGYTEPNAINLDAFFTKHEPTYATAQIKKTGVDYMLDVQCYFDKHPFVALASGFTIMCALLGIIVSPIWCPILATKLAPKNPKAQWAINKTLISVIMATTATGLYKLFVPIRGN